LKNYRGKKAIYPKKKALYIGVFLPHISMAQNKTRYIEVNASQGNFVSRLISSKKDFDFSDISLLRKLLSNEKARILYLLKNKKPKSIYALAKMLGRDFKSVSQDVNTLEKFGFIEFHAGKTGKRESKMPVLAIEKLNIVLSV
jgi:predicted transcriptional regulator